MKSYGQYCALARGLDLVGDRWTLLIVRELLSLGPSRYADLQRGLPGIATNLLAARLRDLEGAGLIERRELPRPVGATVFALTERGTQLRGIVGEFVKWGSALMGSAASGEAFRAHWLLLPLRALCRDTRPASPLQVVRVGTAEDGCDITARAGTVGVVPSSPDVRPDAVVNGDPDAMVALFAGRLDPASSAARALITGDLNAVVRVLGSQSAGPIAAGQGTAPESGRAQSLPALAWP